MNIGQAIRNLRIHKGLRQNELAARLEISNTNLSKVELGSKTPSMKMIEKISKELDTPLAVFLWFSIVEEDLKEEKRELFNLLKPSIDTLVKHIWK